MSTFPFPDWVLFEHKVAKILTEQKIYGWSFNERLAQQLTSTLLEELHQLEKVLLGRFPYVPGGEFTPKRDNKTSGYVKGATFTRLKDTNIKSRDHVAWILTEEARKKDEKAPTKKTQKGKIIIDETVLKEIGSETSMLFLRCLKVTKMLGMISEGANAWLKLSTKSRIHHHCCVNTNTHRAIHKSPNLAQTPHEPEYRQLFTASDGLVMVGADLSSIELKLLAHYLARWSDDFANDLLHGDIHQINADRIGVTRRQIKTITYGWMYGQSNAGLGLSYDETLSKTQATKKGAEIREAFVKAIPGLEQLQAAVNKAAERGYIESLDGRKIYVDSKHKCLNYILQSAAAILSRRWLLINYDTIQQLNIPHAHQLAYIHDELQWECPPNYANDLSTSLTVSAAAAGEYYNLRVPIEAEAKVGSNWAEVH